MWQTSLSFVPGNRKGFHYESGGSQGRCWNNTTEKEKLWKGFWKITRKICSWETTCTQLDRNTIKRWKTFLMQQIKKSNYTYKTERKIDYASFVQFWQCGFYDGLLHSFPGAKSLEAFLHSYTIKCGNRKKTVKSCWEKCCAPWCKQTTNCLGTGSTFPLGQMRAQTAIWGAFLRGGGCIYIFFGGFTLSIWS